MNKTTTILSLLLGLFFSPSLATAQMIWPGDINNNGIVNGVDYLYWGMANQSVGPNRPDASSVWEEQPMGTSWAGSFPQSTNYAYADVNGDGQINANDAVLIGNHFSFNHGVSTPDNYQETFPPDATPLVFTTGDGAVQAGELKEVSFEIGSQASHNLTNFYGLSFVLSYPPMALEIENGLSFGLYTENIFNTENNNIATYIHNDPVNGRAEITMVRTDGQSINGHGKTGRFLLQFSDLSTAGIPNEIAFEVTDIMAIDGNMAPIEMVPGRFSFSYSGTTGACPLNANPVCGSNGVTYLNSCFAEAAGIYNYSIGTCFDDSCIDPSQMDPTAICATVYEPVCGCNGVTYANECSADAAGVISTTPGPCSTNSNNCYDPQYVVTSASTDVNNTNGIITTNCTTAYDPVCGCNGVTYTNAYFAEACGITVYTEGSCESACIDPSQMDWNTVCTTEYDPVCGCNNVTYTNACRADAAGVVTYTSGPCGGTSAWCEEAIPIQCGDFLPYETTIGAGNNIVQYPGCSNSVFQGADRVYVIQKESAGDLQIGLEILTANLDLDLFLLSNNCSQISCLASSTTNNSVTNNEGIILEDAPIGTYYIVVDGQYASSQGNFRLEVSCGYLYCGDAVNLQCGEPYSGSNMYGHDDVSLYYCDGPTINVENNGPEIVHTFTQTQSGPVTINLSGMSSNLELFLLRSCDRGDCMEYSQNSGNSNESISAFLPAGTYYIVVDGYNGSVSDYTLQVDCTSSCDLAWADLSATSSGCGQTSGVIHISTTGGQANYLVSYSGPLSGNFTTSSNYCTISNLPPGTYWVTKTDAQGCSVTGEVTILGGGNLSVNLTPNDAVCMSQGSIGVNVGNGQAPYAVYLTGPTSGSVNVNANNFTINDLDAGDYTVHITDNTGCSIAQQITIAQTSGNFIWNYDVTSASCGGYGAVHVDTYNGDAPYNIVVSGPVSGGATTYASSFNITNLPGGVYQITIEDANWCQTTETIVISDANLNVDLNTTAGICGQNGNIIVNVSNGSGTYTINWQGPSNGSTQTNSNQYILPNLPSGNYTVTVQDNAGCSDYQTIAVSNSEGGGLDFNVIPLPGTCDQNGALWIDILNGSPVYTISWSGPESGILTTSGDGLDIPNLPCGTYQIVISDVNGCSSSQSVVLGGCSTIDIDLTPSNGICGQDGSILVSINGGSPVYTVSWIGTTNGQTTTNTNLTNINDLPAGTYTFNVTDANGCTDYAVTQISTIESNLVISTSSNEATCNSTGAISVNLAGGTGPYQISWSGPESGSITSGFSLVNIASLTAGTYQIYATDANGCSDSAVETITNQASNLDISLVGNDGICSQFGNIGVYVTNGSGPYQVSWSGPTMGSASFSGNIFQIPGALAGLYNVVVTDGSGCAASDAVQINIQNTLNAYLTPVNGQCGTEGAIQVNITQGSPNYTITWSGTESGSVSIVGQQYLIPNLSAGNYTIVIVDGNGCNRTLNTTVEQSNDGLDIITSLVYNICGQYNTIWTDIVGGTPPYTVTWTGTENGTGTTNGNGFEVMDLPPGTYKVTVVDANGCMDMEQGIIIYPAPVDLFTVTPIDGVCGEDGAISINISSESGPFTVNWNGPVSGTQTFTTAGIHVLNNMPTGTYTFTILDDNWCTDTEVVVLNNGGTPVEIITALIYNECGQYNTIWTDIIGGTPPYTITWTGTENGSETTSGNGFEIMDLPPGTYKVTVIDANGCMDMEQGIIVYPAPINIFEATATNGICSGPGSIQVNILAGTPVYNLSWSGPVNNSANFSADTYTIPNLPAGTYTLTLVDMNGCTEIEVVTVSSGEDDVNLITTANLGTCVSPASVNVQAVGGNGNYTLTWSGPENGTTNIGSTAYVINNLTPGLYTINIADGSGCDDTEQVIVAMQEDDLSLSLTPHNGLCGTYGNIDVNISGSQSPYTVTWSGPSNGTSTINGSFVNIPNLVTGTYTISVLGSDGCSDTQITQINNQNSNINVTATATNGVCSGPGSILVNVLSGTPGFNLTWSGPQNGSANFNTNVYTIPNLSAGTYTLTLTDANGCYEIEVVSISSGEGDLSLNLTPHNGLCGTYGNIDVNISGSQSPYTVTWSGPSNGTSTINGTFVNIPNLATGTYTVFVTGSDGCSDAQVTQVVNQNNNVNITATATNGVCSGPGSILVNILSGTPGFNLTWSGPQNGSANFNTNAYSIPNLLAGTYTLTLTDANGCYEVEVVTVSSGEDDVNLTTSVNSGTCITPASINVQAVGGSGNYTLTWSGPENGSTTINTTAYVINNLTPGFYTVQVNDGNGCDDTDQVSVSSQEDDLSVYLTPYSGLCGGYGNIDVNINGSQAPYTVTWSGPSNGTSTINGSFVNIPNLGVGTYTVYVIGSDGCSDTQVTQVNNQGGNIAVTASPINGTCGSDASIGVSLSGATTYTLQWSGPVNGSANVFDNTFVISNLPSGTYTIQASSGSCTDNTTATVYTTSNNITINATPNNGSCITEGSIDVLLGGGVAPYQLSWQGTQNGSASVNQNNYTINDIPAGFYSLFVTDANGCTRSTNVSLSDDDLDISLIPQNGTCGDNATISLTINHGTAPYTIDWVGLVEGFAVSDINNYTIYNLAPGTYQVSVQDANGCESSMTATVSSISSDLDLAISVSNNGCGAFNNIWMDFYNGTLPYTIQWIGPASGSETTYNDWYDIQSTLSGSYTIILTDANGCVHVEQVEVVNLANTLEISLTPIPGSCGENGAIGVQIEGGESTYTVAWYTGNQALGEIDINSSYYAIPNLASDNYFIRVTDENGCEQSGYVDLSNFTNNIYVNTSVTGASCIGSGSIGMTMGGGQAPYQITWTGPVSSSATANDAHYIIGGLSGGTYQIAITDANGCASVLDVFVPGTVQGEAVADFTYTVDGLTVSFESLSSNDYHIWELGDGTISYEYDPVYTFPSSGTYTVCLGVSGTCGSDEHCATITVNSVGEMALLDIGEGSGAAGSIISLPVTLHNTENIVSLAGSIQVVDESVASIVSVTPGVIAPQFNAINNTFSYFANGGNYVTFNEEDILFYLNVLLTGEMGETSLLEFIDHPLPVEVGSYIAPAPMAIPVTTSTGSATITNTLALQGQLETYWGDGIMDAEVTISSVGYNSTMMTNESGSYAMPALAPGAAYTVSADKDIAHNNGLSTYALFIGQRFLLGMNPEQIVSPYQIIAGDANCSDAFTTLDLFLIQRLIIGAADEFNSCPSWVFVSEDNDMPSDFDAYNVFPYASSSTMLLMENETANFVGVKVGDILGQANPNNFTSEDDGRTDGVLPFQTTNPTVAAGEEVTLYFNSNDFEDIVSYQFGLQFSANELEFLSFESAEQAPFQTVVAGDANAAEGKLRLSWYSQDGQGHTADNETVLFALSFRALTDITDWNEVLRIDPAEMLPEAYNEDELSLAPLLSFGETVTSVDNPLDRGFELYQNTPNPYIGRTLIGFYLPQSDEVTLEVRDALGQLMSKEIKYYGAGEQKIFLEDSNLSPGVYFYTIKAGKDVATKSMIVVE